MSQYLQRPYIQPTYQTNLSQQLPNFHSFSLSGNLCIVENEVYHLLKTIHILRLNAIFK